MSLQPSGVEEPQLPCYTDLGTASGVDGSQARLERGDVLLGAGALHPPTDHRVGRQPVAGWHATRASAPLEHAHRQLQARTLFLVGTNRSSFGL